MSRYRSLFAVLMVAAISNVASAQFRFAPQKIKYLDLSRYVKVRPVNPPQIRGPVGMQPAPESKVGWTPPPNQPSLEIDSSRVTARYVINPNDGRAYREVRGRGNGVERRYVGRASLYYQSDGRPYYEYRAKRVWANKPRRTTTTQNIDPYRNSSVSPTANQNVVYPSMDQGGVSQNPPSIPMHNQQTHPVGQIVGGILQIVAESQRN